MKQNIPPKWVKTMLGAIVYPPRPKIGPQDYPELPFVGMDHIQANGMDLIGYRPFGEMKSNGVHFFSGDVLYGRMRPYLNKVHCAKTEGACSAEFIVFPGNAHISSKFLAYLLHWQHFVNFANQQTSGDRPRVDIEDISGFELLLPPGSEQGRIVSKIDELFSQIDEGERALKRVQVLVERYRQSVLKAAVTGELTRDWREQHKGELESGEALLQRILKARREAWEKAELEKMAAKGKTPENDAWKKKYKEPEPPDTTDLPELPEGWVWASLPQLGEFGRGKSKHRPRNDQKLYGGDYPFLQTGTIRASKGRISTFDNTYNESGLAQSKLWPSGTVCITIAANIAASGVLEFDACFPDSVVGLIACKGVVPEYIEFFIRTARDKLDRYAPATAQKNINMEILEKLAIPLPSTLEQIEVFSKTQDELSKIGFIEKLLFSESCRSQALRQSILKAAFSGQLIPQDPTDEPASVLLERIAAERAATPKSTRRRNAKAHA